MRSYFITGTDTDCGKTYISTQLVSILNQKGHRSLGIKPITSGALSSNPLLYGDIESLDKANPPHQGNINLHAFEPAIAPHIAAQDLSVDLLASEISAFCQSVQFASFEHLIIEGAGGLMMPLNFRQTWLDVIQELQCEVIFVVGMRLGCLNHTLLSLSKLRELQIPCAGWIANCIDPKMTRIEENIDTLRAMLSEPCLAVNAWQGKLDDSFINMGYNLLFA